MKGQDTRLLRFMARNALIGSGVGVATVALFMLLDVAGLRGLIMRSEDGLLALCIFTAFFIITFGGVQIGVAVMLMPWGEETDGEARPESRGANAERGLETAERRSLADTAEPERAPKQSFASP